MLLTILLPILIVVGEVEFAVFRLFLAMIGRISIRKDKVVLPTLLLGFAFSFCCLLTTSCSIGST